MTAFPLIKAHCCYSIHGDLLTWTRRVDVLQNALNTDGKMVVKCQQCPPTGCRERLHVELRLPLPQRVSQSLACYICVMVCSHHGAN